MRVARRAVVLVEPLYELADTKAQERMREHGYVRGLKETAEALGENVQEYRLLDYVANPLNPSGLILIEKSDENVSETSAINGIQWRCPLTHSALISNENGFYSPETGIVYPVLAGIPLLRSSHAIVASTFNGGNNYPSNLGV